jgi:hypothetical protein
LQAHFPWNKRRIELIAAFILTLLTLCTVNLSQLSGGINGRAKRASNYRRLQRFFKGFDLEQSRLAQLVLALLSERKRFLVSMDHASWKLGKVEITLLMVGIV